MIESTKTVTAIEQEIICSIMEDNAVFTKLLTLGFDESSFSLRTSAVVFSLVESIRADGSKGPIPIGAIKVKAFQEAQKGAGLCSMVFLPILTEYLNAVDVLIPSPVSEATYKIWVDYTKNCRLQHLLDAAKKDVERGNKADDVSAKIIRQLTHKYNREEVHVHDLVSEMKDRWTARQHSIQTGTYKTITTGFPELDEGLEGGFRTGRLVILVGYPQVGKSFLMTDMLLSAFESGVNVLHVTTENTEEEVTCRAEAMLWRQNYRRLVDCDNSVLEAITNDPKENPSKYSIIRLYPGRYSVFDLRNIIEGFQASHGFKPSIIGIDSPDWLKLTFEQGEKDHHARTRSYEELKAIGEEHQAVILTTSHARMQDYKGRKGKRVDRLGLGDLSDTSGKSRIADIVLTINSSDELAPLNALEIYAAKLRDVAGMPFSVFVRRDVGSPRFIPMEPML